MNRRRLLGVSCALVALALALVPAPPARAQLLPVPPPLPVPVPNLAPVVNAGADQVITLPSSANLTGSATDDGQPNPPGVLTTRWSQVSGPGTVSFSNASALNSTATFSASGAYVLRLTVSDGALAASDDVAVTVNPAPAQLAAEEKIDPALRDRMQANPQALLPVAQRRVDLLRSEEHTSELQSLAYLVCRLLLEKKKTYTTASHGYHITRLHIRALAHN